MAPNEKLTSGADPGDSVSSVLEPYAERLRRVTQSPADGGEEIPENLRPPGITSWLVPLGLALAAPLTALLGYRLAFGVYNDIFNLLGAVILLTHAVLVMLTSYTVATTRDTRARLHGLSYLLGLFILGQLVWLLLFIE